MDPNSSYAPMNSTVEDGSPAPVYDASTGVLTLLGTASLSQWQSLLREVTFSSSSEDPTGTQEPSSRTVSFVINDGYVDSNSVVRTVSVVPVNDAPVLAGIEAQPLQYTENDAAMVVSASLVVSDVDHVSDVYMENATVRIVQGFRPGDVLWLASAEASGSNESGHGGSYSSDAPMDPDGIGACIDEDERFRNELRWGENRADADTYTCADFADKCLDPDDRNHILNRCCATCRAMDTPMD